MRYFAVPFHTCKEPFSLSEPKSNFENAGERLLLVFAEKRLFFASRLVWSNPPHFVSLRFQGIPTSFHYVF